MRYIKKILGYCPSCGRWFQYPKKRRTNTMYENEENNYEYSCLECFEEHGKYWEERWSDYYSQRW